MADVDGVGRLYNASTAAKQAERPSYLSGFASPRRAAYLGSEHDPEKHALGHDPTGGNRFSLATNAERVCAEIMLKQRASA